MRNRRIHNEKQSLVDLGKLISEVIVTRRKPSPQLQLDASSDGCFVVAEKGRLANVLAHLIDNAQQATGAGGVIEVTLQSQESMHILEIRDNGHGMDADFQALRYYQGKCGAGHRHV